MQLQIKCTYFKNQAGKTRYQDRKCSSSGYISNTNHKELKAKAPKPNIKSKLPFTTLKPQGLWYINGKGTDFNILTQSYVRSKLAAVWPECERLCLISKILLCFFEALVSTYLNSPGVSFFFKCKKCDFCNIFLKNGNNFTTELSLI